MLLALLASCSYAGDADDRWGEPGRFELTASRPAPGTIAVELAAAIDLVFNEPPDPERAGSPDLRVYSGLIEAPGTLQVDLLERRLRLLPFQSLRPQLRYQVYLSGDVRGLNGARIERPVVFDFTTGSSIGAPPAPAPALGAAALQPIWTRSCTSCHGGPEPLIGLDLSSPAAARASLAGVPSTAGPLRVVPGDHARSYLVRKLLGGGSHLGPRMPPEGPPLPAGELRQVADWIDGGALP